MQYNNTLSWFNSPSLPSSSSLSDPFYLGPHYLSHLPTPQRRAPAPPTSSPRRRRRPRHIRMHEPASKGLFTLLEVDELEEDEYSYGEYASTSGGEGSRMLSARASSEALSRSPSRQKLDLPQDVGVYEGDSQELVAVEGELSWVSASTTTYDSASDCSSPPTPSEELDDPFFVDVPLDIDLTDIDVSYATFLAASPSIPSRPRRPPPLDLSRTHPYAYSAEINRWYTDVESATPKSTSTCTPSPSQHTLLPALSILPPAEYQALRQAKTPTTPHARRPSPPPQPRFSQRKSKSTPAPTAHRTNAKADPFDLVGALEDLLASCGEPEGFSNTAISHWSDSDSDSDDEPRQTYKSFPLPPPRTPALSPASASSTSSFGAGVPITPRTPRFHSSLPPMSLPRDQKKRTPIQPRMTGDHSFLFNLSAGAAPSPLAARCGILPQAVVTRGERPDSRGSGTEARGSGRLPARSQLPVEWTRV